ncbi:tetratricopeptide repeat protein [Rhodanobacter denitrificans]|uniref:tetratricopeptide repeat protein n=1 Tax=Rhodanobacter denitrificans TaxID=666685 RepID=UPI001F42206A|nr:tetratricopeptide repeat protein [Rhodanobacter denitrificans]UJJ57987.1 tetratricopeptide repeat protein [Rhodanobacter denitrificans]
MIRRPLLLPLLAVLLVGCDPAPKATRDAVSAAEATPPLFDTFGDLHHDVATRVPAAQRYVDQGLRMAYGFNHEAAGRAFAEAARLDPQCAMCVWGQALVLGPNINLPMDPAHAKDATALAARAARLAATARPVDRALIQALQLRYADPAPADRAALDRAYADAMARVVEQFPEDDDAATLYAEALMDLSPWAYWEKDGSPAEFTPRLLGELERVLARNPRHIGAMHYYIHATESSPEPRRAEPWADALAALAPGSGHLVHMPAHTYIRVGRYHDATLTNLAATTADTAFLAMCRGSNGVYPLGYVPHNWHFASMTTGLTGSRTLALQAAEQTARRADRAAMGAAPMEFMQQFVVTPLLTRVRFGDWDAILADTAAPPALPYPAAIRHFARGMAQARKGALAEAAREAAALHAIAIDPAMAKVSFFDINHADGVLRVADALLRGELLRARGKHAQAITVLREAAAAEDALAYNEPADWPLPVRPYLGAALLEAGDAKGAAEAFEQDLKTYPLNGWSLFGLAQAQQELGQADAARETSARQVAAWQWADAPLTAARY